MYVRPHLDFCDVIYHAPKFATCLIPPFDSHIGWILLKGFSIWLRWQLTGTRKGTSCNKIYEQLGWESLSDRRRFHRLVQFFKIQNGFTPTYPKTPIPCPRNHLFGTRYENDLYSIKCKLILAQLLSSFCKNLE